MKYTAEDIEQCALHDWLDLMSLKHWHPLQEISIKNWGFLTKAKKKGWNKGLSDMLVYLPPERCISGKGAMVVIELKKPRKRKKSGEFYALSSQGITLYPEQEEFIEMINSISGCQGKICYGANEAISFISNFLK